MDNVRINALAKIGYYCHLTDFTMHCSDPDLWRFKEFLTIQSSIAGLSNEICSWEDPEIMHQLDQIALNRGWFTGHYNFNKSTLRGSFNEKDRVEIMRHSLRQVYLRGHRDDPGSPINWFPETLEYGRAKPDVLDSIVYITLGKLHKFLEYDLTRIHGLADALNSLSQFVTILDDRGARQDSLDLPVPKNVVQSNHITNTQSNCNTNPQSNYITNPQSQFSKVRKPVKNTANKRMRTRSYDTVSEY